MTDKDMTDVLDDFYKRLRALEGDKAKRDENRQCGFSRFIMLNADKDAVEALLSLGADYPTALTVLIYMVLRADKLNNYSADRNAIIKDLGISNATLTRCLSDLKKRHFISVQKTAKGCTYTVNHQVAWKSYWKSRAMCSFGNNAADRVLTEPEPD